MPRHSAAYDLAALRLHPDGSRVSPSPNDELVSTRKRKRTRSTSSDHIGNRIAKDAGGRLRKVLEKGKLSSEDKHGRKGKRRQDGHKGKSKEIDISEVVETFEEEIDAIPEEDAVDKVNPSKEADIDDNPEPREASPESDPDFIDPRARKRRRFENDLAYLEGDDIINAGVSDPDFPSSDLLKNIHYLAAQHYSAHGQLYNHSRVLRKSYREKARLKADKNNCSEPEPSSPDHKSSSKVPKKNPRKNRYRSVIERRLDATAAERNWQPDMYKMLDGSALVCLGMLVQEFVKWNLKPRIPDDWEDGAQPVNSDEDLLDEGIEPVQQHHGSQYEESGNDADASEQLEDD